MSSSIAEIEKAYLDGKQYIKQCFGIDDHIDYGIISGDYYRDLIIIGKNYLVVDIFAPLLDSKFPAQERFEIIKKQFEIWKSELPLKDKTVTINKEND